MTASVSPFSSPNRSTESPVPDPFVLYSSNSYPKDIESVFRLCEYMWLESGQFKMGLQRVVRYFLTQVEVDGPVSKKEKNKYLDYLNDHLNVIRILGNLGDDEICYGNSFSSLYMPFNRILICDKCSLTRNAESVDFTFSLDNMEFKAYCPKCKMTTTHERKDMRSTDENRLHIIRWNIHEMEMMHNFISGRNEYLWTVDPSLRNKVKSGNSFFIKDMPWEILRACQGKNRLRFSDDIIYHMKEDTICGIRNRGWGIPRVLGLFKDAFYVQLLKRYNEALALDYIVPFRVLSPKAAPNADPLMHADLQGWSRNIHSLIERHRRDPAGWHTVPFPVEYQALGGEGMSLAPVPLIKQGVADMLDAAGVPIEMYQGTMSLQAAPLAIRLFESTWPQIPAMLNGWLQWLTDQLTALFGWDPVTVHLKPVKYADDLDRKNVLLQLMSAQQISRQTALAPFGVTPREETRRIMDEQEEMLEAQQEFEEDQVKKQELQALSQEGGVAAMAMQPAAGGAGVGAGTVVPGPTAQGPVSPAQLLQQAYEMALQLMSLPETQRRSQLIQLKDTNPLLHSAVRQQMRNLEQEAASAGVSQMRQQMKATV